MLDVHPPHEAAHTWKDFFIHIATIVIGLLIAVGLEQTVEAIHHRHQRHLLLDSLESDTAICAEDGHNMAQFQKGFVDFLLDREARIKAALWSGHPPTDLPDPPRVPHPVDLSYTHFQAGRSSGLLQLLSTEDMDAFSDINFDVELSFEAAKSTREVQRRRLAFEDALSDGESRHLDLSKASPADLKEYLRLLSDERRCRSAERWLGDQAAGAALAVLSGKRGIRTIQQAEQDSASREIEGSPLRTPASPANSR